MKDKNYEQYLKDHSNPKVRMMHFMGQWATILYTIWVIWYKNWMGALLIPFVVYPFAVGGHILFGSKGNRPSFYKISFLQAKRCDIKMFIDILRGKLSIW
jgi:hypothetical protein|tara:strand:+ start:703 stop:1002 length:300 start_codon:yes stop_codon:yes gene_type:complete